MVDAAGTLLGKNVNSCGCLRIDVVARPIPIGTRFERLTVVNLLGRIAGKGPVYLCKCDCGNEVTAYENNLKQGSKKSCGCMHTDVARENVAKGIAANFVGGTNLGSIRSKVLYRNNTSGVRGVSWNPRNKNWVATIRFQNKYYSLGSFDDIEDAKEARKVAEEKLHDTFVKAWNAQNK